MPGSGEAAIELEGLTRAYGERTALSGVSVRLGHGQTLAVLGSNGAGKTTLLRILATLLRPHSGVVRILGRELPREGWAVRGRIGLLGHDPLLYRDLTGRENLEYHARLHDVAGRSERIATVLDAVGMTRRAEEPIRLLSRGMVQRLAVARAVLHDPELLLLDEPASHLDPARRPRLGTHPGRREPRPGRLDRRGRPRPRPSPRRGGLRGARGGGRGGTRAGALPVRVVGALLRKDLLAELRTGETVPAMCLFAVTTFVIFHFALRRAGISGDLASGVWWVTVLFAGILGINRLFVAEREQGGFDGFLLAPVDRTAMLVAKATALFLFLAALQVVAVPAFAILLLDPSAISSLPQLVAVLALGDLGIALIGTLTSALAVQTRARDLIVPIVSLPLLVPLVIGAASATSPLWAAGGAMDVPLKWLGLLGLYDLTFGLIAYAVFDFLLED